MVLGSVTLLFFGFALALDVRAWDYFPHSRTSYPSRPFRIGVLGDSQKGLANLRNITRAVLAENVSLLMHTGDLVSDNDLGHYRLAALYLRKGGATAMPVVAPGNHDLKGRQDGLFRFFCGDPERSFTRDGVAFVVLNNAFGTPPDPKHVEARIAAAGPHKAVVLAMHQPPFDLQGAPRPEYAGFLAWLERSGVSYLLSGHLHAYMKKTVGKTTVIVNGVGGDYDSWQLRQKVHATILEVQGTKITDRRIDLDPVHEVWENIEHFAVGHFAEGFRQRPVLCWIGLAILAAGTGGLVAFLLRRPRIPKAA